MNWPLSRLLRQTHWPHTARRNQLDSSLADTQKRSKFRAPLNDLTSTRYNSDHNGNWHRDRRINLIKLKSKTISTQVAHWAAYAATKGNCWGAPCTAMGRSCCCRGWGWSYKRDDSHLKLSRGECQINIIIHYQINYWVCGKPMPNHSWRRNNASHFGIYSFNWTCRKWIHFWRGLICFNKAINIEGIIK